MNNQFILTAVIVLLVVLFIYIISIFNKLVYLKRNIEKTSSTIDVFLKKRYDLIPNLVEVVKNYSKYEKGTLEKITKLRSDFKEKDDKNAEAELHKYYKEMVMLVESYPELKAGEGYLNLQKQLSKVESEIQASRRLYINSITEYNNLVKQIPSNIIAALLGYKTVEYPNYEIHDFEVKF